MTHLHPHRSDDDQIFQKYLDRAIAEINELSTEMSACSLCSHEEGFGPVVGTGHPLADIFMLKYRPRPSELEEGVAFYGRAGDALLKSVRKLNVNPLDLYGTNCIKCSDEPTQCMVERCPEWLVREIDIVGPKLMVIMGTDALGVVNRLAVPESRVLDATIGVVQPWTHGCDAVVCPDIDESLDTPAAKVAFWQAFRAIGGWYDERPPY